MMHRAYSPHQHLNHFTPFLPGSGAQANPTRGLLRMPVDRQRRIELALLAVIVTSLGAAIAGML